MPMSGMRLVSVAARIALVPAVGIAGLSVSMTRADAAGNVTVCARGCAHSTIAAALATATSGEVINVRAGTYDGGFVVWTPVTLKGDGPGRTIIRGGAANAGTVVTVNANPVTIMGVSITGASWTSGSGLVGSGVITNSGAVLNLVDTYIYGNRGGTAGGGGGLNSYGTTNITAGAISGNAAGTAADPGQGGGIHIGSHGVVNMLFSALWGNSAGWGGGIDIDQGGVLSANLVAITTNTATHQGGGVDNNGSMTITRSLLFKNTATQGGGIMDNGPATLTRTLVQLNSATGGAGNGGGAYVTAGNTMNVFSSAITSNTPDNMVHA